MRELKQRILWYTAEKERVTNRLKKLKRGGSKYNVIQF